MSNTQPQADGLELKLGKTVYILPPLPLAKMSKIGRLMQGGDFTQDDQYVSVLVDAIWWSLQRNYGKDLSRDVVEDNIDMTNIKDVLDKFMQVNGFAETTGGDQPGEPAAS